jgi:hypothetical protein
MTVGIPDPTAGSTRADNPLSDQSTAPDLGPVLEALDAAMAARKHSSTDAAVLIALHQAVEACCAHLKMVLDRAIADAKAAQQQLAAAQAAGDRAEAVVLYAIAEAAMKRADTVSRRVEQALRDFAVGVMELSGPALLRLERGVQTTEQLLAEAESRM